MVKNKKVITKKEPERYIVNRKFSGTLTAEEFVVKMIRSQLNKEAYARERK